MLRAFFHLIFLAALLSGCATADKQQYTKANRSLDPDGRIRHESPDWDSPPRLIRGKAPVYPISQLFKNNPGTAVIAYTVGTDGKTRDFIVESSSDKRFSDHAIIAMREWIFEPATKDGNAVEARLRQSFSYVSR